MTDSSLALAPGKEYPWTDVNQIHRQHHGINSKDGIATSIWFETKNAAPYEDRWLVPGRVLDYVGHGKAPEDQGWDKYNKALRSAMEWGQPVHVFEKIRRRPSRFVYHGQWHVLECNEVAAPVGRRLIRFVVSGDLEWTGHAPPSRDAPPDMAKPPPRMPVTTLRIVRDTPMARRAKEKMDHACEVCGLRQLRGDGTPYAEAHHIQPLGLGGPDVPENLIVVCARHHVDFDYGAIAIDCDDLRTLRHRYDAAVDGRPLKRRRHKAQPYVRFHWDEVYTKQVSKPAAR